MTLERNSGNGNETPHKKRKKRESWTQKILRAIDSKDLKVRYSKTEQTTSAVNDNVNRAMEGTWGIPSIPDNPEITVSETKVADGWAIQPLPDKASSEVQERIDRALGE